MTLSVHSQVQADGAHEAHGSSGLGGLSGEFTDRVDLAAERLGGAVIHANDEFFAEKDNLLKPSPPVFIEGKYTDRGKWMDGWETRRRRTSGHDFCIVRLGLPGVVHGVDVDTRFFKGNYPEACSLEGCAASGHANIEELLGTGTNWVEILPRSPLLGDRSNLFAMGGQAQRFTHLRLNIFPDGGVARLRIWGEVVPELRWLRAGEADLAAVENGGRVITCNDMFFGARHNLIQPGRGINMGDGWETRRSRRPGPDWVVLRLAAHGTIHRIEVETTHFKGNAPESCSLGVCDGGDPFGPELLTSGTPYTEILPRTRLLPHTRHVFEAEVRPGVPATHARFCIFPDGGVSRLRLFGEVSEKGREEVGIGRLNRLGATEAEAALRACCGATRWTRKVAAARPFRDLEDLLSRAGAEYRHLSREDCLEAFAAHPRIGERQPAGEAVASHWATQEQAGATAAAAEIKEALARLNVEYEDRFGYIYIVCATGRSGEEMLALLKQRLGHSPEVELPVAAEEQRRIMDLRLTKLVRV